LLINTAKGSVVERREILKALKEGKLMGGSFANLAKHES
jgi:lactate dehydrogenase-like 2-hydroxyacid dehydrogenase